VHRLRRGPALTAPRTEPEPLPQSWVPRVFNAALALFLLACIAPIVTTFGDHSTLINIYLLVAVVPVLLLVGLCLSSALRPGSLGRAARRARARRQR